MCTYRIFSVVTEHFTIPGSNRKVWKLHLAGWHLSKLSGLTYCGSHDDKVKFVSVWETLVSREVEGSPREWTQAPLSCGAINCLCSQLESHLVVRHLWRDIEMREGIKRVEPFNKVYGTHR